MCWKPSVSGGDNNRISNLPVKYFVIIFPCPCILRLLRLIETGVFILFFTFLLGGSTLLVSADPTAAARRYTRPYEFDYVNWTLDALGIKLGQSAMGAPFYFDVLVPAYDRGGLHSPDRYHSSG